MNEPQCQTLSVSHSIVGNHETEIICEGPTAVLKNKEAAESSLEESVTAIIANDHAYSFNDHCTFMCQVLWVFPAGAPMCRVLHTFFC